MCAVMCAKGKEEEDLDGKVQNEKPRCRAWAHKPSLSPVCLHILVVYPLMVPLHSGKGDRTNICKPVALIQADGPSPPPPLTTSSHRTGASDALHMPLDPSD